MTPERDIQNQIDFARDKGIEIGREEGLAQGIEQGRKEERVRLIEAFREKGVPEEIIADALNDLQE